MSSSFLTSERLAERWSITPATLKQWRWNGRGPHFLKIGGRVLYRVEDVEDFESQKLRQNTSQTDSQNVRRDSNR
ncbi:MAG: helix-turn-helix domain-containing protein [Alphaproteobacteria bacterium]|nr:helix-turn-helix domain-containing protein [Alphaproteobacteria bacterium]